MPFRVQARNPLEQMQMVVAARLFYLEDVSKSAIAEQMGVSRFKVARLLSEAVRDGVITFEIHPPSEVDIERSLAIADTYGIRQALVLRLPPGPAEFRYQQLGQACAAILGDLMEEGDVLGVSWGRTLHAMVQGLPKLPPSTIVQIVGNVPTADLTINSLDLVRTIASRSGGDIYPLGVPMVLDSPQTASRLRNDPHVARTTDMFRRLTRAVVGIGAMEHSQSALLDVIPQQLRAKLEAAGAVADICATVLDQSGNEVLTGNLAGRCISITTPELRAVPDVIAIAGGPGRARAIRAALRSGLIHRLVTDENTAQAMLDV